jgi:hypothetical protein
MGGHSMLARTRTTRLSYRLGKEIGVFCGTFRRANAFVVIYHSLLNLVVLEITHIMWLIHISTGENLEEPLLKETWGYTTLSRPHRTLRSLCSIF